MHPDNTLLVLLLPGTVFCILMFMDRKKHRPKIVVLGRELPLWLVYATVFLTAPLLLILMLADTIKRS